LSVPFPLTGLSLRMSYKKCPFCAEEIAVDAIKCKHCGSFLAGRAAERPAVFDYPPVIITAPIIVSACWNAVTAVGWAVLLPCFGLFIAIPYVLLAIYEFLTFQGAESMEPIDLHERCGILAVLQVLLGLTNVIPVVCGVLLLVYRDRLLTYRGAPPD